LKDVKERLYNGILVGVPTFGMVNINFAMNLGSMGHPIFTSKIFAPVIEKPVDVARNEIAATAMHRKHGFVLFRDDDVITKADALVRLMSRMSPQQRAKPLEVAESVVGGVVYSKTRPPTPMIYKKDCVGGFEDWNFGDLVECDAIGMGCTLIPTGVFIKMLEVTPERQCFNERCKVKWGEIYDEKTNSCPHCGQMTIPVFFKTVKAEMSEEMPGVSVQLTEDSYFCIKAQEIGVKIYADCGVQCEHECNETGTAFYYHDKLKMPVWECDGDIQFYPPAGSPITQRAKFKPKTNGKKNGKVRFNLGSGKVKSKRFINIDFSPEHDPDVRCDVRDLKPVVMEHGQADEIVASHVLEHINRKDVPSTVKNWIKALKPGGKLRIEVPDAVWAMEQFIEADKNGSQAKKNLSEWFVFGEQKDDLDCHRSGVTENRLRGILEGSSNQLDRFKVETDMNGNIQVVRATATKKKAKK